MICCRGGSVVGYRSNAKCPVTLLRLSYNCVIRRSSIAYGKKNKDLSNFDRRGTGNKGLVYECFSDRFFLSKRPLINL